MSGLHDDFPQCAQAREEARLAEEAKARAELRDRFAMAALTGLLASAECSFISADETAACGKTFLMADLALHVALGWKWWDRFGLETSRRHDEGARAMTNDEYRALVEAGPAPVMVAKADMLRLLERLMIAEQELTEASRRLDVVLDQ
jgi:glutathione S-transferase